MRANSLTGMGPRAGFGRSGPVRLGIGSVGRGGSVGAARNPLPFFVLLAPNRALRRTENPRVDGSIPSLATTPKFLIRNGFRASPADHPWASMVHPRTIGNRVDAGPGRRPRRGRRGWELGTWRVWWGRAAGPRGGPGVPEVPPEWAGGGRSGAGHGGGHGAGPAWPRGAREVSSLRARRAKAEPTLSTAARVKAQYASAARTALPPRLSVRERALRSDERSGVHHDVVEGDLGELIAECVVVATDRHAEMHVLAGERTRADELPRLGR